MTDNGNQEISARDLLRISAQRGEKTAAELGYQSNNTNSTRIQTYNSISSYMTLNENTNVYKWLKHDDIDG